MREPLERIGELRTRLPDGVLVQVDGGISLENVGVVQAAGADLIVAGSSIFGAKDVVGMYVELAGELARVQSPAR